MHGVQAARKLEIDEGPKARQSLELPIPNAAIPAAKPPCPPRTTRLHSCFDQPNLRSIVEPRLCTAHAGKSRNMRTDSLVDVAKQGRCGVLRHALSFFCHRDWGKDYLKWLAGVYTYLTFIPWRRVSKQHATFSNIETKRWTRGQVTGYTGGRWYFWLTRHWWRRFGRFYSLARARLKLSSFTPLPCTSPLYPQVSSLSRESNIIYST